MLEGFDIICFGPSDWWGMNPSCTIHIMRKLAERNRILYINPFSSDLMGERKGIFKRIPRKLKSIIKWLKSPQPNIHVFSPVFLPMHGYRMIDAANNGLLKSQIRVVSRLTEMKRPIVWIENIRAADALGWLEPRLVVYHVSDIFTKSRYTANKEALLQREEQIMANSGLVVCVSRKLYENKLSSHRNVRYLPHGVDYELFRDAAQRQKGLDEIGRVKRPIAGYYGTLTANNDIETLSWCAHQLPDVSFVLAGPITSGDYSGLSCLPNVHFLGKLRYEQIPALCAGFDVCMLQWKMTDWIRFCNPLKMMEYMASGKPIVSVPIEEVMQYRDLLSVAHSKEQFAEAIRWELSHDTPQRADRRMQVAKVHSWDVHIETLSGWIKEAMQSRLLEVNQQRRY